MITDLPSKDQEIFNKDKLHILTERVDDIPLLIAQMLKMGIQEVIDRHIPIHGNQRDLSWGWATIYLTFFCFAKLPFFKIKNQAFSH